ncbi:tudor and KH domain-containing protein isoform X2 [Neopelma chrysocephalum]|uniref:tudor and KH domain-containing protein isoform X2 n=1 Tax=Neopelma chrysocephalum TaxID=114329 RepID=UPI000FCD2C96|nr:tudor and KH domain-containing protein isoform X2 [Neopelma chrysocephalum]XP_027564189.1 tudor and KH domain-containing protein isoform X2 [Neopelma chrysocephalum]XP_027564190.1 tudor and KH domain-containing protein isoform X2 [Neopelma chrysocephalum]XP_027564191.1 tudor and KH domain-containing protein isoform X3 [Neopelma chrysocephalum]XP_027564192.1 tudor and KH domain-containing protein isoform X2 [Neopelma chrysocephalum]
MSVSPGDIVAAPYPGDGQWYRARVLALLDNGHWDLYYVDFGDNGEAPQEALRTLRGDFLSLPFQAIECSLAGIRPSAPGRGGGADPVGIRRPGAPRGGFGARILQPPHAGHPGQCHLHRQPRVRPPPERGGHPGHLILPQPARCHQPRAQGRRHCHLRVCPGTRSCSR